MPSAARLGDLHFCAENGPNNAATLMIVKGSPNITINGLPAARVGDVVSCRMSGMSTIAEGSSKVFFNGQPAARTGDSTDNGGSIMSGSSNVIIGDGHCQVIIGNSAQVKFGSQCKIYLSASSASENPSPPNPSTNTNKLKEFGQMVNTGGNILAIAGIPLDEVGIGEVMQVVGGAAKGAGKALELAGELETAPTAESKTMEAANSKAEPAANEPATSKPPNQCAAKNPSYKKLDTNYLKKNGVDAHAFKENEVGQGISRWDIQIDKSTGEISLISKENVILPTNYSSLEELAKDFPLKK